MTLSIVGVKVGMTRIFEETGASVPVTLINVAPNRITAIKTKEKDGYSSIQITTGEVKPQRLNKSQKGQFIKADVEAGYRLCEIPLSEEQSSKLEDLKVGYSYSVEVLKNVKFVDVKGITKGKGFQGGVKRHNFSMQDATHGNSLAHRALGSTGQNQTPGRVFKGKKMAGQMGNVNQTTQNLVLYKIDEENSCLMVKGAVPGASGSYVKVQPAKKRM